MNFKILTHNFIPLVIFLCFLGGRSYALPSKPDSLYSVLIDKYQENALHFAIYNRLDSAIHYHKLIIGLALKNGNIFKSVCFHLYTAQLFNRKFEYDSAFFYLNEGLKLADGSSLELSVEKAEMYNLFGQIYSQQGDYANALAYYNLALEIHLKSADRNFVGISDCYDKIGDVHFNMGENTKALTYYNLALKERRSVELVSRAYLARSFNRIGEVYLAAGDIQSAKSNFLKANSYVELGSGTFSIGLINFLEKNYSEADSLFSKSLSLRKARLGRKHYLTAENNNAIGDLRLAQKKYREAAGYFAEAIYSSVKNEPAEFFNDPGTGINNVLTIKEFIKAVTGKSEALYYLSKSDSAVQRLTEAEELLSFTVPLLSRIQKFYRFDNSKIHLRELSNTAMDIGIKVCYDLYKFTGNEKHKREAFLFSETKRGAVLNETKNKSAALALSSLPDSVVRLEQTLRKNLYSILFNPIVDREDVREERDSSWNKQYIKWVSSYDSLSRAIEKDYPGYFPAVNAASIPVPEAVCSTVKESEIILEYAVTRDDIFIFSFSKSNFEITRQRKSTKFNLWLNGLTSSIKKIEKEDYRKYSRSLYAQIIKPVKNLLIGKSNLTIVPCSELALLPFEALRSQADIPLAQTVSIQYRISLNRLSPERNRPAEDFSYYFTGFAPEYRDQEVYANLNNVQEISFISDVMKRTDLGNNLYSSSNASKQNFQQSLKNSKILHIAGHSFADTHDGDESCIIFSDDEGGDSKMTADEITSSKINNDLVVLSSCEGGNGRAAKGEGVISLARSLLAGGAKNTIVALWKVPDNQTRLFMAEFYKELAKESDYAAALSSAKRNFINSKENTFPNTWSAFVLIK